MSDSIELKIVVLTGDGKGLVGEGLEGRYRIPRRVLQGAEGQKVFCGLALEGAERLWTKMKDENRV